MKKLHAAILLLVSILHYSQSTSNPVLPVFNGQNSDLSSVNENYVYTRTYLEPKTFSDAQAKQIQGILFFDGLGKPRQHVAIHTSPTGYDMVTHIPYDSFGRQVENWLPIPMISLNGDIQTPPSTSEYYKTTSGSADALIYEKKTLEKSPLDRLQSYAGPGSDWLGKKISYDYQTNSNSEVYKFTTTTSWKYGATSSALNPSPISYPQGALYKTIVTDEDGRTVTEFKNESGQTILTRKKEGSEPLNTYYIYNEYNQLAFVIPPLASKKILANNGVITSEIQDGLLYEYSYDGWNRLVGKKLPGKGWEFMIYDKQDRLVGTQDAELKKKGQWLYTKYDQYGRVAITGICTGGERYQEQDIAGGYSSNNVNRINTPFFERQGMNVYYDNPDTTYPNASKWVTLLSLNYYDSYPAYNFNPAHPSAIQGESVLSGSPTADGRSTQGMPVMSFVKNIENDNWTKKYTYYNNKGRVIGGHSINHLGGYTKIESTLAFSGVPLNTTTRHKKDSNSPEVKINEIFTYDHQERLIKHTHRINDGTEETLAEYVYNELGQLQNKNVGNGIQSVAYRYNTRGALTHINDPNNLNNKLFGLQLKYTDPQNTAASYSGNIAEVDWATQSDGVLRRYSYGYDQFNRLESAVYQKPKSTVIATNAYNEKVTYDVNGNIQTLLRFGSSDGNSAVKIDDIKYTYDGNKLVDVWDSSGNSLGLDGGDEMVYDVNGNLRADAAHFINKIEYNHLNLPSLIEKQVENFEYLYSADGTKLRSIHDETEINKTTVTDYLDGFQYKKGILQFVHTSEGYYDFLVNRYIYNYKDHLGNVRLSYLNTTSGIGIVEENNYYPFGLKHQGYNEIEESSGYKYGYLGNELQKTGMYDMNARFYMPDLGRFMQHDPLSDLSLDPYGYAFNNPVNFVDPTGLYGEDPPGSSSSNPIDIGEIILTPPGGSSNYHTWWQIENYYNVNNNNSVFPSNCTMCYASGGYQVNLPPPQIQSLPPYCGHCSDGPVKFIGGAGDFFGIFDIGGEIMSNWKPENRYLAMGAGILGALALRKPGLATAEMQAEKKLASGLAEDFITVRHHTSNSAVNAIKKSGSINVSSPTPFGVDVEVAPFVKPSKVNLGQAAGGNRGGGYVEFTVPKSGITPTPYIGGVGNSGRIIVEGRMQLDIRTLNPKYVKRWWPF
ncbi:RHS repeat-associated core domain-containing protein [Chryseobacterium sp. X308]|uniref:RHS repeat domain-containing protein n=1 Tax=Chryseobacterium sp. X308 TaxID=2884873 RepID=UPI001D142044|nr:DUF6443 domain-containing protein [Chryseobacterium sp. X308]MCC3214922.1 RHS repeat-associated core domain-containing protein [Chryseobacterium sp. X308]